MVLTVCFDVLQTCFSLEPLVEAMEEVMGDELRKAGSGSKTVVMDWFHAAQRDFTVRPHLPQANLEMLSVISAPPPPISQILKLTLPRTLTYALTSSHPTTVSLTSTSLPPLDKITATLTALTPSPGLLAAWTKLKDAGAKVILVTNGSDATTRGYVSKNGLDKLVDRVMSCDDVGAAKPDARVYAKAHQVCGQEGGHKEEGERWFVACHSWDVCAARKNGFKTGLILSEQPPVGEADGKSLSEQYWGMYGGQPDVLGNDLEEVIDAILAASKV